MVIIGHNMGMNWVGSLEEFYTLAGYSNWEYMVSEQLFEKPV